MKAEKKEFDEFLDEGWDTFNRRGVGALLQVLTEQLNLQSPSTPYRNESLIAPEKLNWLDVGCGTGEITEDIRKHFTPKYLKGIDISQKCIKYAKANFKDIAFQTADIMTYKDNKKYDVISLINVVHHEPNTKALLAKCHSLLKKGGQIITIDPNARCFVMQLFRGERSPIRSKKLKTSEERLIDYYETQVAMASLEMRNIKSTSSYLFTWNDKYFKQLFGSLWRVVYPFNTYCRMANKCRLSDKGGIFIVTSGARAKDE